jgi:formylglycine-generating enzyme required for sulfatase activity
MIVIPAGSFTMGSPESETGRLPHEGPQHEVKIAKRFAVSRFELTWDEWDACVKYGDCAHNISDSTDDVPADVEKGGAALLALSR